MNTPVAELIAPALEAYGKALDEHGHASTPPAPEGETAEQLLARLELPPSCRCGWTPSRDTIRAPRRAVGIHIAAAHKRAEKAYAAQVEQLLEEARRG